MDIKNNLYIGSVPPNYLGFKGLWVKPLDSSDKLCDILYYIETTTFKGWKSILEAFEESPEVQQLQQTVQTLTESLNTLTSKVNTLESNISTLKTTVTNQGTKISSLESTVGTHTTDISEIKADIVEIQNKLADLTPAG